MNPPLSVAQSQQLLALVERGLPLCARPYQTLAEQIQADEAQVLAQVQLWQEEGLFRRFGIVVKHRALGITANCMLVLDIPDELIDTIGEQLAQAPGVNLCYQRPRRENWPYNWPYNLFCMVHGRCREAVIEHIEQLLAQFELTQYPHDLLFSTRAFKQRGARYTMPEVRHG